jgi:hypothetical protein
MEISRIHLAEEIRGQPTIVGGEVPDPMDMEAK